MNNIIPYDKTTIQTVTCFELIITEMVYNTSATFRVILYGKTRNIISIEYVKIEGQDYTNWNNDDNYVINFVATKLGFVLQP